MNHRNILCSLGLGLAALSGVLLTAGCEDPIRLDTVDESRYELPSGAMVYLVDEVGKRNYSVREFKGSGSTVLTLASSGSGGAANVAYDAEGAARYNAETGNSYPAFPASLVNLSASSVSAGSDVTVTYTNGAGVENGVTYILPIKVTASAGAVSDKDTFRYLFVKDTSGYPSAEKESGIVLFSCMEVNNTNPLNNMSYTLAESGKPLFDVVVLFSSNIKYNEETGRVFLHHNENNSAIFNNCAKYIKPLQERGIKVLLSVLGGGDRSGLRSLGPEAAKEFAREIKYTCDAYDLDGVFFDDEYSSYMNPAPPGFVVASKQAASNLFYETKKMMPERMVSLFCYSQMTSLPDYGDMKAGEFVDYILNNYRTGTNYTGGFNGMTVKQQGIYSQEFALNYYATAANLATSRNGGYGAHMVFSLDPFNSNYESRQLPALQLIATSFYDEELVDDGVRYRKDW